MRISFTISSVGHIAVLAWSVMVFASNPHQAVSNEPLPVSIISDSDFSKMMKGVKDAPQAEMPKPLVEKIAEAKPVDDPPAKVVEKKEVKAAREPPPASEAKPIEEKPKESKAESKQETKPAEAKPQDTKPQESKPDPIADTLAKQESKPEHKPEPKKAEATTPVEKTPTPPKKPAPPAPKFDPKQVEALLDKRDSTRVAAAGDKLNNAPSLGLSNGDAAQLSQNEFDAFRKRLEECWSPPLGVDSTTKLRVLIRVLFNSDGSVARPPEVVSGPASALGPAMAESAKRAILRCQPFKMLKPEHYDQWKDIEINFDPQYMIRG